MNAQGYGKHIQNQIQNWPMEQPITTEAVAAALADAFGIDLENAKKITNVTMKRLADRGELVRVQKGVYGKVKMTPFGKLKPSTHEMVAGLLMRDGEKIIGYITGPTLLNALGLCSWMPKERHITTNNYRRQIPADTPIRVHKPAVHVDNENYPYLQAIEAFMAMEQYSVDAEKPGHILREMLKAKRLSNERLILYARKYYGQKVLAKTIDVAIGGAE
jgi:predicted transcriptional regulator of viral defense system